MPTKWVYESDGEEHARTYYAWRETDSFPFIERVDFQTKKEALEFVKAENQKAAT